MILSLRIMLQFVSSNRYMADHATICVLQPRSPNITSCCSLPRHSPSGGGSPPNRRSNGVSTTHVEAYRAAAPALQVFSLSLATISSQPTCPFCISARGKLWRPRNARLACSSPKLGKIEPYACMRTDLGCNMVLMVGRGVLARDVGFCCVCMI